MVQGFSKVNMKIEVYSRVDISFKETKTLPTYRPTGAMIWRFTWLLNVTSIEGVSCNLS
jgi:hypothetical protein